MRHFNCLKGTMTASALTKWLGMAAIACLLTSCAALDSAVGSYESPGPIVGIAKGIESAGGPWSIFGTLALGGISIYQGARGLSNQKKAKVALEGFKSVVAGLDKALDGGLKGGATKDEIYSAIQDMLLERIQRPEDRQVVVDLIAAIKARQRVPDGV